MKVSYGDNQNLLVTGLIDYPVWESLRLAHTHVFRQLRPGIGKLLDAIQRAIHFLVEFVA